MVLENIGGLEWIIFWFVFGLFMLGGIIVAVVIGYRMRWNFSWVLIEKGKIIKRGKCRLIPFGDGGEEVFYLRGLKRYRVAYGKRIGVNQIAWAVGKDGYWYNVELGDLDTKLMEVGVMPVDRDMRYAYASVRKGLEKRYDDKTFMEKWGATISIGLIIIALIIFGVTQYYSNKKSGEFNLEISKNNLEAMKGIKEAIVSMDQILGGKSAAAPAGDSGLKPVT